LKRWRSIHYFESDYRGAEKGDQNRHPIDPHTQRNARGALPEHRPAIVDRLAFGDRFGCPSHRWRLLPGTLGDLPA
jgi:hypothetical protein